MGDGGGGGRGGGLVLSLPKSEKAKKVKKSCPWLWPI